MTPIIIESANLSAAWIDTLKKASDTPGGELFPFVLSLTGFEEDPVIRKMADQHHQKNKKASILTVSETIFPQSLYRFLKFDKNKLYAQYIQTLPRIMAVSPNNQRGTYF